MSVVSKRCAREECPKQSSYRKVGSRTRDYCAEHSLEGMVLIPTQRQASAKKRTSEFVTPVVNVFQGGGMGDGTLPSPTAASDGDVKVEVSVST